jgi:TolB-like protein/tetratricopeptide (TPR) repeat protein
MTVLSKFFGELRRRGVYGTAALYIVAGWVAVQVASETFPAFHIPEYAIRYVWIGVILGLPLALVVGWMYDVSTAGVRRTAGPEDSDRALKRFDYFLLSGIAAASVALVLVLAGEIAKSRLPEVPEVAARAVDPHSIAVLPLDNFTGDPDQDYFVSGLHEVITAGLAGIRSLKVISRTSASAFVGSSLSLPEIGRALGVANIIEGSVFRSGNRVRITVQLIDARTDEHLWAENYERDIVDMLALHGEVTRAIAEQIQVTLTSEEQTRLSVTRRMDPEIYEHYIRGMYFLKQFTEEGLQKGMQNLYRAVELDPANARAHAGLALGYVTIGHGIGRDAFPKAIAAARQALALDEFSGEAWAALAESQLYWDYDWESSEKSFRRALQLSPSLDHAHAHYAYLLSLLGRWDEVFPAAQKARELSPLDPTWPFFEGWLHMVQGRHELAEQLMREALELAPDNPFALYGLGQIHVVQGQIEDAIQVHERLPTGSAVRNWSLGPTYAMAGRTEDALAIAADMARDPGPKDKLHLGFTHAALGDFDTAMDWFEACYVDRVDWLPWIALVDAYGGSLEKIRRNPRFIALVAKLNLEIQPES